MQATTTLPASHAAAGAVRAVSLLDNLAFNLGFVIPNALQGTFVRSRFWVGFWTRVHSDPLGARLVARLRRKYASDYLYVRVLTTKMLLVLDPAGIRQVLDRSPEAFAEPPLKRDGMSHWQPGALTISRGAEWKDRRRFNETVLAFGQAAHPHAARFLEVAQEEVLSMLSGGGSRLKWKDFDRAFERLALGVILGKDARADTALTTRLGRMMREANRPFFRKRSRHFDLFYAGLRAHLQAAREGSLAGVCPHATSSPQTRVENQVAHWIFAMKDTLATNTARALALIVSHPRAEAAVRREIAGTDLTDAEAVVGMKYLRGCVQEAMRLWPTTPMLVRETVHEETLNGVVLPAKTQVLIHNGYNHRELAAHSFADSFTPEVWLARNVHSAFNHLSSGPQVCAGKDLVLLLSTTVLAMILCRGRYVLEKPALVVGPIPHAYDYFALRFARRGEAPA